MGYSAGESLKLEWEQQNTRAHGATPDESRAVDGCKEFDELGCLSLLPGKGILICTMYVVRLV